MSKALIVIDYTNDFVADDGKLTCGKPGQKIDQQVLEKITKYLFSGNYVVIANDIHYPGDTTHPENKLFPEHNIVDTLGRNLYGMVGKYVDDPLNDYDEMIYRIDKTRYSAFVGTNLELYLKSRNINEIELCGVCTDICVLHTAIDAYNKGYDVTIDSSCVASFNPDGHTWALNHFKNSLGFKVI